MTQEDKELLFKDLCARLPYGVKVQCGDYLFTFDKDHMGIGMLYLESPKIILSGCYYGEDIKPYLFPLSSMTEEQKNELEDTLSKLSLKLLFDEISSEVAESCVIDFYNKKHIDYRGLIPMGLAIDATGLNIY
jgi:hypothetical protein